MRRRSNTAARGWRLATVTSLMMVMGGLVGGAIPPVDAAQTTATGQGSATPAAGVAIETVLRKADGKEVGTASFREAPDGAVLIDVEATGLKPGDHGIHIHETGICDPDSSPVFSAAGRHYNPSRARHGGPPTADDGSVSGEAERGERGHAGDLGNIVADDSGTGRLSLTADWLTLSELADADGSALVIHRDRDDLESNPEGDSGARVACGAVVPSGAAGEATPPVPAPGATPPAAASSTAPNVVVIMADDLDTPTFEAALPRLPNLSALVADGATATNFIISTPLCCPSRATFLRGQYAHNHGVLNNVEPSGGFPSFQEPGSEESTIATWLDDAGYQTALIGKYLNRYPIGVEPSYVPPGWDEWAVPVVKSGKKDAHLKFNYALNVNGDLARYGDAPEDYVTDVLTRRATDFVSQAAGHGDPFFLFLTPTTPHGPFDPAPRHVGAFAESTVPRQPSFNEADTADKPRWIRSWDPLTPDAIEVVDETSRLRLEMMLSLDDMVGEVVQTLRDTGELEDTYVVFVSDNGFHLGEHRFWAKRSPYEESIRVPLVIRGPGIEAGQVVDGLTMNTDIAPTVADWANVETPDFVDGRSLAPLLAGEAPPNWRAAALVEVFAKDKKNPLSGEAGSPTEEVVEDEPNEKKVQIRTFQPAPAFRALRTDRFAYIEYETGEPELYDLQADPHQIENLAGRADPEALRVLSDHLAALASCRGEECRRAEDAPIRVEPGAIVPIAGNEAEELGA